MKRTVANAFVAFVAILAVVSLLSALVAVAPENDGSTATAPEVSDVEQPQYDLDRFDINETPGRATVQMESTTSDRTVVIHTGEGVLERTLQPMVSTLTKNDHEVRILSPDVPVTVIGGMPVAQPTPRQEEIDVSKELDDADAFVSVSGNNYNRNEISAIENFAAEGGRVLLLSEPRDSFDTDTGLLELQSALGVSTGAGYIYNLEENDLNYQRVFATPQRNSRLTAGVDRAVFQSAAPLTAGSGVLSPIDGSKLSTTRAETDASLLTRNGSTVLAGDTDFISPTNALRADNDDLIGNLADFLVTGERQSESGTGTESGDMQAVSTGGFFETNASTEQRARQANPGFSEGTIEITANVSGNRWKSLSVETSAIGGARGGGVELAVPDGPTGTVDVEANRFTLEGVILLRTERFVVPLNVSATSGESGALTGAADLGPDGGTATVVDNEFTIESTGNPNVDRALGLPTEEPGLSWFELELDIEFTASAGQNG